MIAAIRKHPLLTCMTVAFILRLIAVIFSRGYMASDDFFETVKIAYQGVTSGLTNAEGLMRWDAVPSQEIARSPLYNVALYAVLKLEQIAGIANLDPMMYLVRLLHALLSLLTVWYGFKYIKTATGSDNFALVGGLILAGHFLLPYLAVRNLIEQVSADFFVPAIFFVYIGTRERDGRYLLLAGILSGLSWMFRFNVGAAILPIPFAVWYLTRSIRPAVYYCLGLFVIFLFSGSLDLIYLGSFGRSNITLIKGAFVPALLPQPFWFYFALVAGVLIPPFSIYFMVTYFRRSIIREHLILFSSALMFFLAHTLISNKQERFLLPIFPLLIILGIIGLKEFLSQRDHASWNMKLFKYSAIMAVIVNIVLLPVFTTYYVHKGAVEPFVYLSRQNDVKKVLVDSTERIRLIPFEYEGFGRPRPILLFPRDTLGSEDLLGPSRDSINYFVIFTDDSLSRHLADLESDFGRLEPVFHSTPSLMDGILHALNPNHNLENCAWVCRRLSN
ncbi:membrane hypothetical protein [Candidatus Zixiibacteriota bacterium]|nr:membrane hypothetical protein [candidate division Zixibacteria bacterium]